MHIKRTKLSNVGIDAMFFRTIVPIVVCSYFSFISRRKNRWQLQNVFTSININPSEQKRRDIFFIKCLFLELLCNNLQMFLIFFISLNAQELCAAVMTDQLIHFKKSSARCVQPYCNLCAHFVSDWSIQSRVSLGATCFFVLIHSI